MIRSTLKNLVLAQSKRARQRRGELFLKLLAPTENDLILDLGGGDGSHIASIIPFRENVWVADVLEKDLAKARERGFKTILLSDEGPLPFEDKEFDIVFCSSVIEHVTIPKAEVPLCRNNREFHHRSWHNQQIFASEIQRIGKWYYVQTPHKYFPIESHTWLPVFIVFLPRPALLSLKPFLNRYWIKQTSFDHHLLTARQMKQLFPDAQIYIERFFGFPKSIIAVKPRTS